MSGSERKPYLTASALTQQLLNDCADNLECRIEMIVDIESPDGWIRASDRNKYVGGTFYEALLRFPVISRTVGEWLAPDLQFSSLNLELSNVDKRFSKYLASGENFAGWIGKRVIVKVGLAELESSYRTIFNGMVTDVGGFKRSVQSIIIVARDKFDSINNAFPTTVFSKTTYPKLPDANVGKLVPVIYGTWKEVLEPDPAIVPTFCVNGNDPLVDRKERQVDIIIGSPALFSCNEHNIENDDPIKFSTSGSLPTGIISGLKYYVKNISGALFEISLTPGGSSVNASGSQSGIHKFQAHEDAPFRNVSVVISHNNLKELDTENIYLLRQSVFSAVPSSDIQNIGAGNKSFDIVQNTSNTWVNLPDNTEVAYVYDSSDIFVVRCVGEDLGTDTDNIIMQAKHILMTYGGLVSSDFDGWDELAIKYEPPQSNIAATKSRAWIEEQQHALQYALSMLEQIRCEASINNEQKLQISTLHFDDFVANPPNFIKNWDIEQNSLKSSIDEQNNFNRAQALYSFSPLRNEQARSTPIYKNQAAIDRDGKAISKRIEFPNLYEENTVINNLKEILKLSSSTIEKFEANLTWRSLLRDVGDFIAASVSIGSIELDNVPCLIRDIGIDPDGLKIPVKVWSFQMCPFPGYEPGFQGIVGGFNATIESET